MLCKLNPIKYLSRCIHTRVGRRYARRAHAMPLPWYTIIPRKIFVNKHEVRLEANGAAPSKAIRASRVSVISHLIYAYLIANTLKIDRRFGFSMLCKSFCQTTPTTASPLRITRKRDRHRSLRIPQYHNTVAFNTFAIVRNGDSRMVYKFTPWECLWEKLITSPNAYSGKFN